MNKKQVGASVLLLALLAVVAAWWLGTFKREDPLLAEMRQLAESPPAEQNREAVRDSFRQRMEGMTEEQRQAFFEQMAPIFIPMMAKRFEAEYDKFMAMSREDRNKELDRRIDEMMARGGPGGPRGPGAGPGGGGGPPPNVTPQQIDAFRKKMLDWTTPEQRAKFDSGLQMFRERMKQRGLTPPSFPGGGFF